jgi:hypothetical protein
MSFHGSARHLELAGNFGIVAALQKQFDNLLLAWSQPNRLLRHSCLLSLHFWQLYNRAHWVICHLLSTHHAIVGRNWL